MTDTEILHKFSQRVKELRIKKNLTQQQLAELSDMEYKYIQKIEGKKPPSLGLLKLTKLIKALDISFTQFFNFIK